MLLCKYLHLPCIAFVHAQYIVTSLHPFRGNTKVHNNSGIRCNAQDTASCSNSSGPYKANNQRHSGRHRSFYVQHTARLDSFAPSPQAVVRYISLTTPILTHHRRSHSSRYYDSPRFTCLPQVCDRAQTCNRQAGRPAVSVSTEDRRHPAGAGQTPPTRFQEVAQTPSSGTRVRGYESCASCEILRIRNADAGSVPCRAQKSKHVCKNHEMP
jgi:hypothetical protein